MQLLEKTTLKGGEFLIKETLANDVFIPEEFSDEQKMIAQTCYDFVKQEVWTRLNDIDNIHQNPTLMPELMRKSGTLGMLGTSIPEQYGGFGMSFNTSMLVAEAVGGGHSFAVALSAHTGIATLPILYYGNETQKQHYLPKLASGEWIGCYCLTEPDSGSDANAAKTTATLNTQGTHYAINGRKMWITNGGFANILIVFARIENDKNLTAFILDNTMKGISMNPEEHKMGIKGSSTRQIFFDNVSVPIENMLSTRGNGFKIAVNILNIGRIKLGAAVLGGMKRCLDLATKYANERSQFGQTIGNFGAIKHKLGEMATRTWVTEATMYRAGQNIDDAFNAMVARGIEVNEAKLKSVEQFAIECAIVKVHASEVLDYCVDESVQIHGGMGFSAECETDRGYRDARINRIYEGTNEINRMLAVDMLLKRALKGEIDMMTPASAIAKELTSIPDFAPSDGEEMFANEKKIIKGMKKAGLMIAGSAVQKLMLKLQDEQEILMNLADILIEIYAAESALLRVEKMITLKGEADCAMQKNMAMIYLHSAVMRVQNSATEALFAFGEGDELRMMQMGLKRFLKVDAFNLKNARRAVADALLEQGKYCF